MTSHLFILLNYLIVRGNAVNSHSSYRILFFLPEKKDGVKDLRININLEDVLIRSCSFSLKENIHSDNIKQANNVIR